jgi:ribose-phosphate pyrophosphokinase
MLVKAEQQQWAAAGAAHAVRHSQSPAWLDAVALPACFSQGRESIAAKLTANLITEAGADRVLAMDLHSGQCVGYFDIPVDHVYGETVILDYLASKRIATGELVVVSPDVGGVARARAFAKKLNDAPLAIIDKRRSAHNVSEVMHLIGDVRGKVAVLVDDMIDTAGTITNAGRALLQEGAREVSDCCCCCCCY